MNKIEKEAKASPEILRGAVLPVCLGAGSALLLLLLLLLLMAALILGGAIPETAAGLGMNLYAGCCAWLGGRFAVQAGAVHPSVGRVCWLVFRWPATLLLFRWLPFAGVSIPVLFFLRGCSLSYSIAALASIPSGLLYAGVLFGPSCLLAVPAFFLLGSEILLRKASTEGETQSLLRRGLLCGGLFLLSGVAEYEAYLPSVIFRCLHQRGSVGIMGQERRRSHDWYNDQASAKRCRHEPGRIGSPPFGGAANGLKMGDRTVGP
ncbi:hypothetical protein [Evtepia sp.]|uniref:hypothetical protein n=1 Tax=Evtepia sp. TaxID=2773933 RepID=UPI002A74ED17|nr:hypothetical protein [Evtepia sp.]